MPSPKARRWMRPAAVVFFVLGAVLCVIALLQELGLVAWLDDPFGGVIGLWLLAFLLTVLTRQNEPPATESDESV